MNAEHASHDRPLMGILIPDGEILISQRERQCLSLARDQQHLLEATQLLRRLSCCVWILWWMRD